jgi:hypothetical protein
MESGCVLCEGRAEGEETFLERERYISEKTTVTVDISLYVTSETGLCGLPCYTTAVE